MMESYAILHRPFGQHRPEGAVTYQPRAERIAALGFEAVNAQALKGRNNNLTRRRTSCFALSGLVKPTQGGAALCPGLVCFWPFGPRIAR